MLRFLVAEPLVVDADSAETPSTSLLSAQPPAPPVDIQTAQAEPADAPPALASGGGDIPLGLGEASSRTGIAANGKAHFSIDEAADQLVRGLPGWSATLGQPFTVTYAFRATAPTEMPDDITGFSQFTAAQIAQAELSLRLGRTWPTSPSCAWARAMRGPAPTPTTPPCCSAIMTTAPTAPWPSATIRAAPTPRAPMAMSG